MPGTCKTHASILNRYKKIKTQNFNRFHSENIFNVLVKVKPKHMVISRVNPLQL